MKAQINGANIYYEVSGTGSPLVLIEGLGYSSWMWFKQRALSQKHTLVIYDNRGVGGSDRLSAPYTMDAFAQDLYGLLKHLGIARTHLLGVSMGGMIALNFTLKHPEMVGGLVLVSTSHGKRSVPADREVLEVMFEPLRGDPKEALRRKMGLAFSPKYPATHPEEFERILDMRLGALEDQASLPYQAAAVVAFDVLDRLGEIVCPTLIITGDVDRVVPMENSLTMFGRIPSSELHVFRGAGHLVHIECGEEFNSTVLDFLDRVERGLFRPRGRFEHTC